jgi:hypothetical protein
VTEQIADIGDDRVMGEEQMGPCGVGAVGDEDFAVGDGFERVGDDDCSSIGLAA